jgi:uncharacterized membrane protein
VSKARTEAKRRARRKSVLKAIVGLVGVFLVLLLFAATMLSFWHGVVVLIVALGLVFAPEAWLRRVERGLFRGEP